MKAITLDGFGGPETMRLSDVPDPSPGRGEVLIRVEASSVNRPDVMQRQGRYPPPAGAPDILGLDVAGRIAALGEGAEGWRVGDPVCALVSGGGYAELCVAPAGQCLPIPAGLSAVEAACLPEVVFTVWANVFMLGRLQAGESLLIHGGASGIGTTAIQLAAARGATVYATAGTPEKAALCETLGAARGIDYRREDFVAAIAEATGGRYVDLVVDMVGGAYVNRNLDCLAFGGRHVGIAFQQGREATIDLGKISMKRLTLTGSTMRPRSVAEKTAIAQDLRREVWPLIEAGRLRPIIYRSFPLAEAADAHRVMESGEHIGKIALVV